jgi:hypothetical protein
MTTDLQIFLSRPKTIGVQDMKYLVLISGLLFVASALAQAVGTYFTSSPKNTLLNGVTVSAGPYQLEVNSYTRKTESDPWNLIGSVLLCFSAQTKPNCYHSVANFLSVVGLPKISGDPVVYANYTYGLDFGDPAGNKVKVTTHQSIKRRIGSDGSWADIFPALVQSEMDIDVSSWASIDFRDGQDSMKRIEARIVQQSN